MENKQADISVPVAQVAIHQIGEVDWLMLDYTSQIREGYDLAANIRMGVRFSSRVEPAEKLIVIRSNVAFQLELKVGEVSPLLSYTVDVAYLIDNFSEIFKDQGDNHYEAPDPFLQTLCSIALSTIRGLLVAKTATTYLRSVYLPILSHDELKKIIDSN